MVTVIGLFKDIDGAGDDVKVPAIEKLDHLTARRIARDCVAMWREQSPDLQSPYSISTERRPLAKCSAPEYMELVDIDDAPKRHQFENKADYLTAAKEYAIKLSKAKKMCNSCPLLAECRTASMMDKKFLRKDFSVDNVAPEKFGVWGGLTPEDRKHVFVYVVQVAEREESKNGRMFTVSH